MAETGIVRDERFMEHQMGPYHPESPKRLEAIYAMLDDTDMRGHFQEVPVRRAEIEELLLIHSPEYVEKLAATEGKDYTYLDPDTQTSSGSYEAALLAAGGMCEAISLVHSGELNNAFALVRPPGHHAEKTRAMGFCLFNNVAIGARYAQKYLHLRRVLVADWDLHHGNGTQHSFEDDPSILYFSTHQYPFYPGSGGINEVGIGKGEGFTVNVPLSGGYGDGEYVGIFERVLRPIAIEFNPEIILVSAGFDIYMEDPLGGMRVTPTGFAAMTRSIMQIGEECCGGNVVITLEGGYDIQGQCNSVKAVLKELSGLSHTDVANVVAQADPRAMEAATKKVIETQGRYWKSL
ncbi:MAG: histone deacetylase [Deltaproteobacteria bacterium]|nr:histone deacetylase [Deltaproteobacteria bacterium]